jgi:hypothetical protein
MGGGGYAAFTAGSMGIQFFLVPFLAWRLIAGKEERRSLPLLLLASTLGVLFVESLLFARFLPILAVPAAVSLGALWGEGTGRSRTRILAAATIGSLAVSSGLFLRNLWLAEIHYPSELMAALRWIRNETPPATSDSWSETEMPAYGIVSRAGFGGFLIHHAERPALDSPFDTDLTHLARYEAVGIRIARSEREGVKGIRKNRVRYLLTYPSFDEYADLFRLLGREVPGDLSRPNRSSIELLETRLHLMNGSYGVVEGKHLIPALERFRLVYQSEETRDLFGRPFPTFKVFEFVEGAIGKIDPPLPSDAILELELRPEKGETTHYRNFLHRGTKEVRLPYATSGGGVSVRTGPRYRLILPDRVVPIEVSEKASRTGGEIAVPIQGSRRTP